MPSASHGPWHVADDGALLAADGMPLLSNRPAAELAANRRLCAAAWEMHHALRLVWTSTHSIAYPGDVYIAMPYADYQRIATALTLAEGREVPK